MDQRRLPGVLAQGVRSSRHYRRHLQRLAGNGSHALGVAGCTEAEIVTITGHSLRDVRSILDAHCLSRDPALGESAIR